MFGSQLKALLYKNFKLQVRGWKLTILQLFSPLIFVAVLVILQAIAQASQSGSLHPSAIPISPIQPCIAGSAGYCHTLLWSPTDQPGYRDIMTTLAGRMNPPLRVCDRLGDSKCDIVSFNTTAQMEMFIQSHPNVTNAAIEFFALFGPIVSYNILYNVTADIDLTPALLIAMDAAILSHAMMVNHPSNPLSQSEDLVHFSASVRAFPSVRSRDFATSVISQSGALFLFCPAMFNFLLFMYQIATERERLLDVGLLANGMMRSAYWVSWIITQCCVVVFNALFMEGVGFAFGFPVFRSADFLVTFLLFLTFGMSLIPLGLFLGVFISKAKSAAILGFLVFVVGLFLQLIFAGSQIYTFFDPDSSSILPHILQGFTPFAFGKYFSDLTTYIGPSDGITPTAFYSLQQLYIPLNISTPLKDYTVPPSVDSLYHMLASAAVFLVLFLYFDSVIPRTGRLSLHPLFFILPSFYRRLFAQTTPFRVTKATPLMSTMFKQHGWDPQEVVDLPPDVLAQRSAAMDASNQRSLRVMGLSKTYKSYNCCGNKDVIALADLYLHVTEGSLLALLGHNGAGKTTAVSCLTGTLNPSGGTASLYGYGLRTHMNEARQMMGVCPQHDLLWEELTLAEHIKIFCGIRGMTGEVATAHIDDKLRQVELQNMSDKRADACSGGQRRRLSVALSTVGNPKILFLDEPTSGMDPHSRHEVWHLIQHLKSNHVIVMTTHTMDEANKLADNIAIMAHGTLRCIGTPLELKARYAGNHVLTVSLKPKIDRSVVLQVVGDFFSDALISQPSRDVLAYTIKSNEDINQLPALLEKLESGDLGDWVTSWALTDASLEDVFLKVTADSHVK